MRAPTDARHRRIVANVAISVAASVGILLVLTASFMAIIATQ
jgi:hypothetical protein